MLSHLVSYSPYFLLCFKCNVWSGGIPLSVQLENKDEFYYNQYSYLYIFLFCDVDVPYWFKVFVSVCESIIPVFLITHSRIIVIPRRGMECKVLWKPFRNTT